MLRTDLSEMLQNGESSGVEFKRDDVHPDALAKELSALLNLRGGVVLLGVEDDGTVSGLTRSRRDAEEWVMNVCRSNLQPAMIPYFEVVRWDDDRSVGVVRVPADAPDRPYKARRGSAWTTYIRVGTTARDATREEEARLYQRAGLVRYETRPVPGTTLADLDLRRLRQHVAQVLRFPSDSLPTNDAAWARRLIATELMVAPEGDGPASLTIAGALLFGIQPRRFLPQAGVKLTVYPGREKDYATVADLRLSGPLVSLTTPAGDVVDQGLIDQVITQVRAYNPKRVWLVDGVRHEQTAWPDEAIREAIANAFVHRDWSIYGGEIVVDIYADRLEILSPGRLPNGVTVEGMRLGLGFARNPLLRDLLKAWRYVDDQGLGVPRKIIRGMQEHNGTQPDLIEGENWFIVRLFSAPQN